MALLARRAQVGEEPLADRRAVRAELRRRAGDAGLRGGGSADLSACRTVRRCTRWRRASPRIDAPPSRLSRPDMLEQLHLRQLLVLRCGEFTFTRA